MSTPTEPQGRPLTFSAVLLAGTCSAAFNIWGAFNIWPEGPSRWVFAGAVTGMEIIAISSLRHIVTDWTNNHRFKPTVAAILFSLAVVGCALSGHKAFHALRIEAAEAQKVQLAQAGRIQAVADDYFAQAAVETDDENARRLRRFGETEQRKADAINIEVKKRPVPGVWFTTLLLILFEGVKMAGRFAIATPSALTWSPKRRRIEKLKADKAEAELRAELGETPGKRRFKVIG